MMPLDLSQTLVVGISSTALFDLDAAEAVFRDKGISAYRRYMLDREEEPLAPGTAYPLARALLALNAYQTDPEAPPLADVVVLSRNSPETGTRIVKSIRHLQLPIARFAFTGGEALADYIPAFDLDLFLSRTEGDVQAVIDAGACAAAVLYDAPEGYAPPENQVRIAFDADAVLVSDDSEAVYQTRGLPAFQASEDAQQDEALHDGPYANLLRKLSGLQHRLPDPVEYSPIRLSIVTARSAPAELRLLNTLRTWGVYVDATFFLGGRPKGPVLEALRPHIFFDDQEGHLIEASRIVPAGRVPYRSGSKLGGPPTDPADRREVPLTRSPADEADDSG